MSELDLGHLNGTQTPTGSHSTTLSVDKLWNFSIIGFFMVGVVVGGVRQRQFGW